MQTPEPTVTTQTQNTLQIAHRRAVEAGIGTVLVASTSGATGLAAAQRMPGLQVVVITHSTGFSKPGVQEADPRLLAQASEAGARILTTCHAFGGVGRAIRRKFASYQVDEIIAQTLRMFGQGTKVAVEIAVMAADAGLAPVDQDVISIGGTGHGADTALVLRPAHTQDLFDLSIREILCKPR